MHIVSILGCDFVYYLIIFVKTVSSFNDFLIYNVVILPYLKYNSQAQIHRYEKNIYRYRNISFFGRKLLRTHILTFLLQVLNIKRKIFMLQPIVYYYNPHFKTIIHDVVICGGTRFEKVPSCFE